MELQRWDNQIVSYLTVALWPIVRPAEHLAVLDGRLPSFAPGGNMVSVHLCQFPDPRSVGIMADGAVWTVWNALFLGFRRLVCVNGFLCGLVENTDIQQARLLASAEDLLIDAPLLLHEEVLV